MTIQSREQESNRGPVRVEYSPEDEKRFGVRTARAVEVTEDSLPEILEFCRENRIELLIARCEVSEIRAAQALEREGCFLTDTLVRYVRNLVKHPVPELPGGITVRPINRDEEETVGQIAADAFRDYGGHYRADGRLARVPASEIYASWAVNSCRKRDRSREVLVAEYRGEVAGFTSVQLTGSAESDCPLGGVAPSAGRRSMIMRALSIGSMNWARSRGASRQFVSMLITNRVMQKILIRLDFEPEDAHYTFHGWL